MSDISDRVLNSTAQIMDNRNLYDIKAAANQNSPAAMKAAAQQFEALFLNIMLKTMRASIPEDGLFNTPQTRLYTQLLDEEISQQVAKQGMGLADQMLRQMVETGQLKKEDIEAYLSPRQITGSVNQYRIMAQGGSAKNQAAALLQGQEAIRTEGRGSKAPDEVGALYGAPSSGGIAGEKGAPPDYVGSFISQMTGHARQASMTTGIPPEFMMAQAALETGWGKKQIMHADGTPSYNLFGIKANGWSGRTVDVMTSEFEGGRMVRKVESFRAYDSYADSFKDYAKLLSENPRYKDVMNAQDPSAFAYGLQRAGYATDPQYGSKLVQVIHRVRQG